MIFYGPVFKNLRSNHYLMSYARAFGYAKAAQPYVRAVGGEVTKRYKRPIHRGVKRAADFFESVTGFGDYNINNNSILSSNAPPLFQSSGSGVRISHKEYLGDIRGSIAFNSDDYLLNPGDPKTFPWLSRLCSNFEQFQIHGCIFEFRSTCGDAVSSTNNSLGIVAMATDYDVYDEPFASKVEMAQTMFSSSGMPSRNLLHPIECDPDTLATRLLYIRHVNDSTDRDRRFLDMGRTTIATQGQQADDINLGELWVTYDISLLKACTVDTNGALQNAGWDFVGAGAGSLMGSEAVPSDNNFPGISCDPVLEKVTFPENVLAGQIWQYVLQYAGSATTITAPTIALSNIDYVVGTDTVSPTASSIPFTGVSSAVFTQIGTIAIGSGLSAPSITWSGGNVPTSPTTAKLFLSRIFP